MAFFMESTCRNLKIAERLRLANNQCNVVMSNSVDANRVYVHTGVQNAQWNFQSSKPSASHGTVAVVARVDGALTEPFGWPSSSLNSQLRGDLARNEGAESHGQWSITRLGLEIFCPTTDVCGSGGTSTVPPTTSPRRP